MGIIDSAIKGVGGPATIIRDGGNISTHAYISPKAPKSAFFERDSLFPTDSQIVDGDLIQVLGSYYLAINVIRDERVGEFFLYKAKLYKCNYTVTVKAYSGGTFAPTSSNVPCLIIDSSAMTASDRGVVVPGFGGRSNVYYLYAQSSSGINKNSVLVDSDARSLRIAGNVNPYFAKGVLEAPVMIEGV